MIDKRHSSGLSWLNKLIKSKYTPVVNYSFRDGIRLNWWITLLAVNAESMIKNLLKIEYDVAAKGSLTM